MNTSNKNKKRSEPSREANTNQEKKNEAVIVPTTTTLTDDSEIRSELRKRMRRMLCVLAAHHSGSVVLGAWGCGVFKNDPRVIAELFEEFLCQDPIFRNRWPKVVFAVLDRSRQKKTIHAFEEVFEGYCT